MYGEQYQRSNSAGFMDLGSRWEKASSGLVNALTKSRRYCPGFPESVWAIARGAIIASSSCPPLEMIPVTASCELESPERSSRVWPDLIPKRRAKFAPTTASAESSEEQRPWTCQPGLVAATPGLKTPPPFGIDTSCPDPVPSKVVQKGSLGEDFR